MKMGSYSKSVKGFKGKAKIVNEEIKFKDAHKDTKIRIKTDVLLSKKMVSGKFTETKFMIKTILF